jgi:maltodextrin utilization protein YvdJ
MISKTTFVQAMTKTNLNLKTTNSKNPIMTQKNRMDLTRNIQEIMKKERRTMATRIPPNTESTLNMTNPRWYLDAHVVALTLYKIL